MTARIELLIEILCQYKKLISDMKSISARIEKNSQECYKAYFTKNMPNIGESIAKYGANVDRAKMINDEITSAVGNWYDYIKNPDEVSKFTYPLRYHRRAKALKKKIKSLQEELSSLLIENRFISEQVTIWQQSLETEVVMDTRKSQAYMDYNKTSADLEALVSEIKYLIPTIPGLCPSCISIDEIDTLIEKLRCYEAA